MKPIGENNYISVRQFTILVFLYSVGTAVLVIPSGLAEEVKQDAWIAALISIGISLLLVKLYVVVGQLHAGYTLIQLNEKLLGKWVGRAASIGFVLITLITAAELLYYMGNFMTTQILPETPMQATNIIFALIVIMGVRLGLEVLSRSAEILFSCFLFLTFILLFCAAPEINVHYIQPVLETGMKPLIRATLLFTSIFSLPAVVFLMIYPSSTSDTRKAARGFYIGMILAGLVLTIIIACTILVLGAETTARQVYPSYTLAKRIIVGTFIQHIEVIVAVMWFITIYFKMSIYFYAACLGLSQTLGLSHYRKLIIPLGILMVVLSLILHPNTLHYVDYNKTTWLPFIATFGLVLPIALLCAWAFRKHRSESAANHPQEGE